MNKPEFINELAERSGLTVPQSTKAVEVMLELLTEQMVKHDMVRFVGFGTFMAKLDPARLGRNPQTNEPVPIPPTYKPVFKAGEKLRNKVAGRK